MRAGKQKKLMWFELYARNYVGTIPGLKTGALKIQFTPKNSSSDIFNSSV